MENYLKIINNIGKNVGSRDWNCISDGCIEKAINSHLLQENGILKALCSNDNHLIQLKPENIFISNRTGNQFKFERIGINRALALKLFCKNHDDNIFKSIEKKEIDFYDYKTHLLFSYRATCAEIRRKQIAYETNDRVLKSKELLEVFDKDIVNITKSHTKGLFQGIKDLTFFKKEFEKEIHENDKNKTNLNYSFKVYEYNYLPLCASATFSPVIFNVFSFRHLLNKPFKTVFVNLIPYENKLFVILGYHRGFTNNWIKRYIKTWDSEENEVQQNNISELFANRLETWAISPEIFNSISAQKKDAMLKHWESNIMNHSNDLFFGINLFAK